MSFERWFYVLRQRARSLLHGRRLDQDLDEELRQHLDRQIDRHVAAGFSPEAARTAALRAMGGVQQRKEECRDTRGMRPVEELGRDLRYAIRTLLASPGFTVPTVAVLALAIGISTAMFSIASGVWLKPLPFPEADRLFALSSANIAGMFGRPPGLDEGAYLKVRDGNHLFSGIASFAGGTVNLTGSGEPRRLSGARVTTSYFRVLRVDPVLGRTFRPDEDQPGQDRVVILSERLWRDQFAGDAGILGTHVMLDGISHEVIGVMPHDAIPSGLMFPSSDAAAWMPLELRVSGNSLIRPVIGRLKDGVDPARARAELEALTRPADLSPDGPAWRTDVLPLKQLLIGNAREPLLIFCGVVAFVLLVACANVANLFLVRTANRQREMSVRAALGAGRGRLVRQLLVESLVVSLAGGAVGAMLAYWGVPALRALAPAGLIPRSDTVRVDTVVLAFTLAVSAVVGVLTALAPALQATRPNRGLAGGGRTMTVRYQRLSAALVVSEIALTLVLSTGAALLLGSFVRLRAVDSGFRPEQVMTMTVELPSASYTSLPRIQDFHDQVLIRLREHPSVSTAGAVNWLPLGMQLLHGDFEVEDGRPLPDGAAEADKMSVSPGYFGTMGIRLLHGRDFSDQDRADAPGVVIVSESVARNVWPGEDAIGRRIALWTRPTPTWLTVVGVVEDVKQQGPARERHSAAYQPYAQVTRLDLLKRMTFVSKVSGDAGTAALAMRAVVRAVDPDQPLLSAAPMGDLVARQTALPKFQTRVLGALAVFALALTVVGIYGVLSYVVAQQRREIAVRMALGARTADVRHVVFGRSIVLTSIGTAIGLAGSFALTGVLRQFLFELSPTDPATFGIVTATVVATALAASIVPAWRAARVDPTEVLRAE